MKQAKRIQERFVFAAALTQGLSANMRCMTRILLVAIFLVPILWVWPQRGITAAFYTNPHWRNEPALVRVERQINLDFVTADSASLPQQEFSVEWSGWLRIDRDGEYTFSTRTDDGSTIEIDGHVVVDNGGVHPAARRTATIAMTPGLHQIRLRFLQATDVYEFYASWTPPGDRNESALPAQQLFVHKPPAVIVFLTRRVSSLWALCWFALALVIAARIAKRAREIASADLRRFALRLTLALATTIVTLLGVEGMIRLAALPPRGSAVPRGAAAEFSGSGAVLDARSESRRHCSAEPARGHRLRTEAERSWTIHGPASPHQLSGASRLRVQPCAKNPAHFGSLDSVTRRCSGGACHSRIAA